MIVFTFFLLARPKMQGGADSLSVHASTLASGVKQLFLYCFRVPTNKLHDAISSQVACLLKVERKKRGLSLNVLAQKAGVSRQTVSYVEQEVQNPTLDTLLRITGVLEIDLEKIIAKARKATLKQKPSSGLRPPSPVRTGEGISPSPIRWERVSARTGEGE